jgi:hypothetical protein
MNKIPIGSRLFGHMYIKDIFNRLSIKIMITFHSMYQLLSHGKICNRWLC